MKYDDDAVSGNNTHLLLIWLILSYDINVRSEMYLEF